MRFKSVLLLQASCAVAGLAGSAGQAFAAGRDATAAHTGVETAARIEIASATLAEPAGHSKGAGQSGGVTPSASQAAEADPETAEIVVTAQKRAERLIDTPQSVTALSAADLSKLGATQFTDFANTVPGLQFTSLGTGRSSVNMRGVTSGVDVGPTVGIYVDEVPYGPTNAFSGGAGLALDVGLFDLDRVEVLRGPQGTIYGASSMGGVLKYVTPEPSLAEVAGSVQAGLSDTRNGGTSYNGAAMVNVPIVDDKVAVRASGFYSKDGGYVDNIALGRKDVDGAEVYGGRVQVLLKPSDDLSIRITAFGQDIRRDGALYSDYALATSKPVLGALEQSHPVSEPFRSSFRLVSAAINYDLGFATATSVTSYQYIKTDAVQDLSSVYVPLLGLFGLSASGAATDNVFDTKKFSQEVRLASPTGKRVEWLIGGFYTHEKGGLRQTLPVYDATFAVLPIDLSTLSQPTTYREIAAFGDVTLHLGDKFDVTGGIRYARNDQSFEQIASGLLVQSQPRTTSHADVFTYLANARYRFTPDAMAYVRYATGYRPGGPNALIRDPLTGLPVVPGTFKADTLKSYEAGFKANALDRTLSVDAAVYYIDWRDIQVQTAVNGVAAILNSSGAHIKGAELTLTARPDRNFVASGAFAYNDSKITRTSPALGAVKGDRLPNSARFTATVNTDYVLRESPFKPSIGATLRYIGKRTASFDGNVGFPQYRLPDYVSADVRLGAALGPVDLQLYVHNLFDVRGQLSAYTPVAAFGGPAEVAILRPRTFGITAMSRF